MRKVRKQRSKARRLGCLTETLESRLLLDGTVAVTTVGGAVTITGDNKDNAISISMSGGNYVITGVDTTGGPTLVKLNGGAAGASQSFLTTAGGGDWTIDMTTGGNDTVAAGTDLQFGNASGAKSLIYKGSAGNDSLFPSTASTGLLSFMNDAHVDEVQTITPSVAGADGGTYTISYNGNATVALAAAANTAAIQAALRALPGLSTVTVTGSMATTIAVEFTGMNGIQPTLVVDTVTGSLVKVAAPVTATVTASTPYQGVGVAATGTITITDAAGVAASGTITLSSNLVAGDRITLNDGAGNIRTYTAVAAGATGSQFNIGGNANATLINLEGVINATGPTLGITAAAPVGNTMTLTNDVVGPAGNKAIVISTAAKARMSATGLTGGSVGNVSSGDYVELDDGVNPVKRFTFGGAAGQIAIGATAAVTATNLIAAINAVAGTLFITASDGGSGVIGLVQDLPGTEGNTAIAVSGARITAAGGAFTGGLAGTNIQDGDFVTLDDGLNAPITFTGRTSSPGPGEFLIGTDAARTLANFAALVNAEVGFGLVVTNNYDGTFTVTNEVPGVFGNTAIIPSGANIGVTDMDGGTGYAIDCLDITATMGEGANSLSLGAGGSGQSYIFGNITYTGGASNDAFSIRGAFVGGNVTIALGAADVTVGDSVLIADEGTINTIIGGNFTVTQLEGLSTISLANSNALDTSMTVGGNVNINVGNCATGTAAATFQNVNVNGTFTYTGGTGADQVDFTGNVDLGDLTTIALGAGANTLNTVGIQEVQITKPDVKPTNGTFTVTYNNNTSGAIAYDATLAQIQAAVRLIPGLEGVTVTGTSFVGAKEVQTLSATVVPIGGTYTLSDGTNTTAAIAYNASPAVVKAALVAAGITGVTVTGEEISTGTLIFTYDSDLGDVAFLTVNGTSLNPVGARGPGNFVWTESVKGEARDNTIFTFPTSAGDVTLLSVDYSALGGVGACPVTEKTKGSEYRFGSITGGALTYTGGAGIDIVSLDGPVSFGGAATFALGTSTAGDSANSLTATAVVADGAFSITGGSGADNITLGSTNFIARSTVAFTPGDGANVVTMPTATVSGALSYSGGKDNDTFTVGANSFEAFSTITLGGGSSGTNLFTLTGRSRAVTFTAPAGATGSNKLVMGDKVGGSGYNVVGALTFSGATATSELDFDGRVRNLIYTGGSGADTIKLGAGAAARFICTGYTKIDGGGGATANTFTLNNADIRGADASGNSLTYLFFGNTTTAGAANDTVDIGQGVSWGVRVAKGALFNLGNGANSLKIDNSIFNGNTTILGGTGVDTVKFDVAGTSRTVFNRAVAITGNGGADVFTDSAVAGTAGTLYMGRTAATRVSFTTFKTAGTINGGAMALLGRTAYTPVYTS